MSIVLTKQQLILLVLATVLLSTAIGFVLASVTQPQSADAASSNRAVVSQLKKLNSNIGTSKYTGLRAGVESVTNQLHSDLADTCRALGGGSSPCPDFSRTR
jgi:hypothetical protein